MARRRRPQGEPSGSRTRDHALLLRIVAKRIRLAAFRCFAVRSKSRQPLPSYARYSFHSATHMDLVLVACKRRHLRNRRPPRSTNALAQHCFSRFIPGTDSPPFAP